MNMNDASDWNNIRAWVKEASNDDLRNLSALMKLRHEQLNAEVGMSFNLGEMVQFDAKNKGVIQGKFLGIKRKNATVVTDAGAQWTVSPGLLRKV